MPARRPVSAASGRVTAAVHIAGPFKAAHVGQPTDVKGDDDTLEQAESLDSDEVRNDDGDEVVDPPDEWIDAEDNESLDDKLAAEVPDGPPEGRPLADAHDSDRGGALGLVGDEDLDRIDPGVHGRTSGQIDGAPEDGDPFFDVTQ
jgi:hypothetical protein